MYRMRRYSIIIPILITLVLTVVPIVSVSQTPPSPPASDIVTIEGYISYYDVNNNLTTAANLYVYAAYANGTPINFSSAMTFTDVNGYYQIVIPRPSDNLTRICIANLTYCSDPINVSTASALTPLVVNITVPRLDLASIASVNSSRTIIVYGSTPRWGPRKWDAHTDDMAAAAAIAQALPNAMVLSDIEVASWNSSANKVCLKMNISYVANSEMIITVGGFGANAVTWRYAFKPYIRLDIGLGGKPALLLPNGAMILFNGTVGRFFYINSSGVYNVTEVPWLNASSDKFGKVDFAVVFIEHDIEYGKRVVVVEGFTRFGTKAAGLWLKDAIRNNSLPSGKAIVVLVWNDVNNNKIVDPDEVSVILQA